MIKSFLVSDIHGDREKYKKLFDLIRVEKPELVFCAGDLLPFNYNNFIEDFLLDNFIKLKNELDEEYPKVLLIFGNDDPKKYESNLFSGEENKLWYYIHNKKVELFGYDIYGYSFVPPTPFLLKDWEKYDVSRYVDPGCISPEEGKYTVKIRRLQKKFSTIKDDLDNLVRSEDYGQTIFLFHTPPYQTKLDRAALDEKIVDHVHVDVHVGSIAVREIIELKQPHLTLHGHIHESTSITGSWKDNIGKSVCFNAAHNGRELSVINFDLDDLASAKRLLI